MKKSAYPLYNLLFPIWLLWIFPITWLLILPANLILDLTVIVITLKVLKIQDGFSLVQKSIWKVWIMGFAADLVGSLLMFSVQFFNGSAQWTLFANAVAYDPYSNPWACLWVVLCIAVSGALIYLFNMKFSFRTLPLDKPLRQRLALSLALFTAPYLFLVPTSMFF